MTDDDLESPSRISRLLWRSWTVVVVGLAVWPAVDVVVGRGARGGQDLMVLAWLLLLTAPVAGVVAWWLAATPRPAEPRYAMTRRELGPGHRREIDLSLRRGEAAAVAGRPFYARARVAQGRRELITLGPIVVLVWSMLLLQPDGGWFWLVAAAGVAVAVTGILSVTGQLRRERALSSAGVAGLS